MKIIITKRGGGKTTRLIEMADEHNGYIVTLNHARAVNIVRLAEKMRCHIKFPITYRDFLSRAYYPPGIKKVYIDDLDEFIQHLSLVPVEAVTLTVGVMEHDR